MESKKINQLATNVNPQLTDLTTIGDPINGQLKKITWLQVAHLIGAQASVDLQQATDNGNTTTNPITTAGLTLTNLTTGVPRLTNGEFVGTYGYGLPNGVASLDSAGKLPASQLTISAMEYKGTWNAATNTPTLADGTGNTGDIYVVTVAGTQNLGSGNITFAIGDWVIYNGTIWEKSTNSNAVTSVFGRTGAVVAQEGDYNIDQLGDVAITSAATNDYLRYNGTGWVNTQFPTFVSSDKLVLQVRNNSGATINKGTVVYINGASGGYPTIAKALANADSTSAQTLGLVQDNISNNSNGVVVLVGQITGLDTSAYAAGTQLYLSGTTAGAYTSTKTLAPTHLVYVGIVSTSNAVNGAIEVKIQNGYELDEIHDVAISSVANNQGLFYESSTSLWKNKSISTILGGTPITGSGTINQLAYFNSTGSTITSSSNYYIDNATGYLYAPYIYATNQLIISGTSGDTNKIYLSGTDFIIQSTFDRLRLQGGINDSNKRQVAFFNGNTLAGYFDTTGVLSLSNIPSLSTAASAYIVSDGGTIKYRTPAQVRSDIGAQGTLTFGNLTESTSSVLTITGGTGAVIGSGTTIEVKSASASQNGIVTTGAQSFSGAKTFNALYAASISVIASDGVAGSFVNNSSGYEPLDVTNNGSGVIASFRNSGGLVAQFSNSGSLKLNVPARSTAATIFLTTESTEIKSRTAAQVLSDIGAQAALTNPVTGTGTANQIAYFSGTSTIASNSNFTINTSTGAVTSTLLYSNQHIYFGMSTGADYYLRTPNVATSSTGRRGLMLSNGTNTELKVYSGGNTSLGSWTEGDQTLVIGTGYQGGGGSNDVILFHSTGKGNLFAISAPNNAIYSYLPHAATSFIGDITMKQSAATNIGDFTQKASFSVTFNGNYWNSASGSTELYTGKIFGIPNTSNVNPAPSTRIVVQAGSTDTIYALSTGVVRLPQYTTNGFVKFSSSDGTLSVDTNTYLTTSSAASTYLALTGGTLTGTLNAALINSNNISVYNSSGNGSVTIDAFEGSNSFLYFRAAGSDMGAITSSGSGYLNFQSTNGTTLTQSFFLDINQSILFPKGIARVFGGAKNDVGNGNGGSVTIKAGGAAGTGTSGNLFLGAGAGGSTNGSIQLGLAQTSNSNTAGLSAVYLTIASGGAATFSNNVTMQRLISSAGSGTLTGYIANTTTAASGSTGYGLAIESEASASTSYALTVRNLAQTTTYFHIATETGKVGYVGINTSSPSYNLDVSGQSRLNGYNYCSSFQFQRANSNSATPAGGTGILVFDGGNSQMRINTNNQICFDVNNGGSPFTAFQIRQNGNVVGINSPDNTLVLALGYQGSEHGYLGGTSGFSRALLAYSVNGGYVYLKSDSTWVSASDRNRKKNFVPYTKGLNEICGLKPTYYQLKTQDDDSEISVGLIAQEVGEVLSEAYNEDGDFIGVGYNAIIVTMINAIKQLKQELDNLKNS